jgi:glycosyltransferase involved in cell wall biosynthesis
MTIRLKILWIPHTGWHIPQRAHLFCRALAERHEVHVTDWVADFSKPRDYLSRRYLRNFTYRHYMDGKIKVHGIPRFSPALFLSSLRRLNTHIYSRYVQAIIDENEIDAVIGTFVVPPPKAPLLIFDLFDDNVAYWLEYRNNLAYAKEIEKIEQAYILQADKVITVSSVLADKVAPLRKPPKDSLPYLIPNGVDINLFRKADGSHILKKYNLAGYKIIGMISAFGESRGLLRLIEAFKGLADSKAALLIVGDGPQLGLAIRRVKETNLANVIFTGRIPFEKIADYYQALDIGVIPFDKNNFTDSACPIKLLEYSAAGKVVVSTNLVEIQRMNLPNVVIVDSTPSSLADGICKALSITSHQQPELGKYDVKYLTKQFEDLLSGSA